jgi:uncharacterized pyridoxal phosphate-containing UPF0001 family protein
MMNPYLIAVSTGAGLFLAKKLFDKIQDWRKPDLSGVMTVAEFREKREELRQRYADNREVIKLLDTLDDVCSTLRDEDEIQLG